MKGLFLRPAANFLPRGVVVLLLATGCAQGHAPQGHYQSTPIVADGNADQWPQPLRFTNPAHTYSFNVTNDNTNIYVCVITRDARMQQRYPKGRDGCFLSDQAGKEKHDIDLSYPESNGDGLVFNTSGFLSIENGQFNVGQPYGCPIRVVMTLHPDSTLVYEAIVPLYTVLKRGGLDPKTLKKDFSVGIVIGALADQRQSQRSNNGGYRPHMPGMRGGGFGSGGGYGGGGRGGQGQQPKSQNEVAWYTFRFAQKN